MPTLIAIETSTELASVALLRDGSVRVRESSGAQTHSMTVLTMVQELLHEAGITLKQCDALAFGAGPGSFTGVRTACGLAQGVAFGANLPVVPVVTLLAMAQAARAQGGGDDIMALLDARMGEVYWAQYRYTDQWHTVTEPTLSSPALVLPIGGVQACGNGLSAYAEAFTQLGSASRYPQCMPHARQIAELGMVAMLAGHGLHARDAQPLYLRNKVALTTRERLAKVAA